MQSVESAKAVLFDFDGLLVDTEIFHWRAYRQMCAVFGCQLTWDFPTYLEVAGGSAHGIRDRLMSEHPILFQGRTWQDLYALKKSLLLEQLATSTVPLMPGVEEFLQVIRREGKPMAVVTHSPKILVDTITGSHPLLSTIPHWVVREQYSQPKPAPDGYLRACEILEVQPGEAVGFEDTLRGIESLCAAGCRAILINGRDHDAREQCSAMGLECFSSFNEILR